MKNRIMSLVLALVLICSFTACSGKILTTEKNTESSSEHKPVEDTPRVQKNEDVQPEPEPQVNLLDTMSHGEKTEVNIFLSNFSEASYGLYYTGDEAKIEFAFIHAQINKDPSVIKYVNNEMGISAYEVDTILNRFFGSSVPHQTPAGSQSFVYKDGYFMKPAAFGESYAIFSIAYDMRQHTDGNYIVKFSAFNDEVNTHDMLQSWYSLTYNEAVSNMQYGHLYDGEALLKPKGNTYELVSYKVYGR